MKYTKYKNNKINSYNIDKNYTIKKNYNLNKKQKKTVL